jgi:transposase
MRYELADDEWAAIKPMLPNKPRGVPRVNDRRVLNGIFWCCGRERPWRDLPDDFGPYTTCYNRFVRWRRAGVWGRIMDALAIAHDASVQMIDTSIVRVHQHGACIIRNRKQSMGRSRGGLTSKIPAVVDTNGLAVRLALTAGEAHDDPLADKLLSRLNQDQCCWQIGAMMPIGSEPLPPRKTSGPTSHRGAIEASRSASARISTVLATWSNACSTRSSTAAGLQRATTDSPRTTLRSFNSRRSGYGCALMSPRPSQR